VCNLLRDTISEVPVAVQLPATHSPELHQAGLARRGLSGFLVSGLLTSLLGALLPAWGHHVQTNFIQIGSYFLFQGLGLLAGNIIASYVLRRKGIGFGLSLGSSVGVAGLLILAFFTLPVFFPLRLLGLFLLGSAAAFLNMGVFHAISSAYLLDPASTTNLAGVLYGLGCFLSALIVSGTFYAYSVMGTTLLIALMPATAAIFYARCRFPNDPEHDQPTWKQVLADFRSPAAVLFALFLFFQFGNEWALAGWLPLFLTLRLGISPATSLLLLAVYWIALLFGRLVAQWLLPRISHGKLLVGSVISPLFAVLILSTTKNLFGATVGVLLAGTGFSVIYPLVVEKIGARFPYFHPGFFNGIFSVAALGGLLAPASIGMFAYFFGISAVMFLPLLGTFMVFVLLLLLLLEARMAGKPGDESL